MDFINKINRKKWKHVVYYILQYFVRQKMKKECIP